MHRWQQCRGQQCRWTGRRGGGPPRRGRAARRAFPRTGGAGGAVPLAAPAAPLERAAVADAPMAAMPGAAMPMDGAAGGAAPAPALRVREYFPETMLWQPALITDEQGMADLAVTFADSI